MYAVSRKIFGKIFLLNTSNGGNPAPALTLKPCSFKDTRVAAHTPSMNMCLWSLRGISAAERRMLSSIPRPAKSVMSADPP